MAKLPFGAVFVPIWLIGGLIVASVFSLVDSHNQAVYSKLVKHGVVGQAVVVRSDPGDHNSVFYSFVAGGQTYSEWAFEVDGDASRLHRGDVLPVVYDGQDPTVSCACDPRRLASASVWWRRLLDGFLFAAMGAALITAALLNRAPWRPRTRRVRPAGAVLSAHPARGGHQTTDGVPTGLPLQFKCTAVVGGMSAHGYMPDQVTLSSEGVRIAPIRDRRWSSPICEFDWDNVDHIEVIASLLGAPKALRFVLNKGARVSQPSKSRLAFHPDWPIRRPLVYLVAEDLEATLDAIPDGIPRRPGRRWS